MLQRNHVPHRKIDPHTRGAPRARLDARAVDARFQERRGARHRAARARAGDCRACSPTRSTAAKESRTPTRPRSRRCARCSRPVAHARAARLLAVGHGALHPVGQAAAARARLRRGRRQRRALRRSEPRQPARSTSSASSPPRFTRRAAKRSFAASRQEMLELSTPVVKLWDGVLALPLIGTLDRTRTQVVMETLLQRIVDTGSRDRDHRHHRRAHRGHAGGAAPAQDGRRGAPDGRRVHHQRHPAADRADHRASRRRSDERHRPRRRWPTRWRWRCEQHRACTVTTQLPA